MILVHACSCTQHLMGFSDRSSLAFETVRWTKTCRQWRRQQSLSRNYKINISTPTLPRQPSLITQTMNWMQHHYLCSDYAIISFQYVKLRNIRMTWTFWHRVLKTQFNGKVLKLFTGVKRSTETVTIAWNSLSWNMTYVKILSASPTTYTNKTLLAALHTQKRETQQPFV